LRSLWRRTEVGHLLDPGRSVFVDEMSTRTTLAPLYAHAPIGEGASFEIPRNRATNTTTLLWSLHAQGMGPPSMAVEGATPPGKSSKPTWSASWPHPAPRTEVVVVMVNLGEPTGQRE
jgi:hypothetical protein